MKKFGLPKCFIHTDQNDIHNLFVNGKRINSQSFDLFYSQSNTRLKVLFTASKRIKTHAKKNRAKRLLRELFRLHKELLPCGRSIAFVAKQKIFMQNFKHLEQEYIESIKSVFD